MVNKIKKLWDDLDWLQQLMLKGYATVFLIVAAFALGVGIGGCAKSPPPKAEKLILMDGQTALLLEDITVLARIPYQGGELYTGPVTIQKGSMVVKPKVEQ